MLDNLTDATNELQQWDNALEALVETMRTEMDELKAKVVELEGALVNGVVTMQASPQVDALKPKEFKGS